MPACLTFIHENLYMHEKREPICTPIYPHRSTASRRSRLASRSTRHLGALRCCRTGPIDTYVGRNTDRKIDGQLGIKRCTTRMLHSSAFRNAGPKHKIDLSFYQSGLVKSLGGTAGANAG